MAIKTNYVAGDQYLAADHNDENVAILGLQGYQFGTGADGALNVTSGTTNIDCASQSLVIKNYTSVNISSGATLSFTNVPSAGLLFVMRVQGNCTIAGKINLKGFGSSGGASVTSSGIPPANGNVNGNNSATIINSQTSISGKGGGASGVVTNNTAGGGSGGANSLIASTVGGGTGGGAAATGLTTQTFNLLATHSLVVCSGAGGGSGGAAHSSSGATGTLIANSGAGGAGGGGMLILCCGTFVFTGEIDVRGNDGGTPPARTFSPAGGWSWAAVSGGGGGGGGGGIALCLAKTLGATTGTKTLSGGTGSAGVSQFGGTGTCTAGAGSNGAAGVIEFGLTV